MNFLSVSNVDGASSTRVRLTAIPDSYDVIPVRNQILELDLVNTKITAGVDAITSTGQGYTTTTTIFPFLPSCPDRSSIVRCWPS